MPLPVVARRMFCNEKSRTLLRESLCLLLVMGGTGFHALQRLEHWHGPAGSLANDLFIPAIMMIDGRGFRDAIPAEIPSLREFLDFRIERFDTENIPEHLTDVPLHPYQEFHRYLIYAVALFWKIFGISWDAIKLLLAAIMIISAMIVYRIGRTAMNPVCSLMVAFGFSTATAVMMTLPILRDFAKAPFILLVILIIGTALKQCFSRRLFLLSALALGVSIGVGMGFRREILLFLLPSAIFLALCPLYPAAYAPGCRLAAAALFLLAFSIPAFPIYRALRAHGDEAAHDTMMGFATHSEADLGLLIPASHEKQHVLNDLYCSLRAHDAGRRGVTLCAREYQANAYCPKFQSRLKQRYVVALAGLFPADVLLRAYGTVLRAMTGIRRSEFPFFSLIEKAGLAVALLSIAAIAWRRPVSAFLLIMMLGFFCGYTSLQFSPRHAFHLSFIPYWFAGFLLHHGFLIVRNVGNMPDDSDTRRPVRNTRAFFRCALFWGGLACVVLVSWHSAAVWQKHAVKALSSSYENAPKTPVPHATLQWNDRIVFVPLSGPPCAMCQNYGLINDSVARLMVAEFSGEANDLDAALIYEWHGEIHEFGNDVLTHLKPARDNCRWRYYFPVHETSTCDQGVGFVGLSLPYTNAQRFVAFHEVTDMSRIGLLLHIAIPEDRSRFEPLQRLQIPYWHDIAAPSHDFERFRFHHNFRDIRLDMLENRWADALIKVEQTLQDRPGSIMFSFLRAEILEYLDRSQEAYEQGIAALSAHPGAFMAYVLMDHLLERQGGEESRFRQWSRISKEKSDIVCAPLYAETAMKAEQTLQEP